MGPWESVAAHNQKRGYGAAGYSTIDEKPKRKPGADLKRLANLRENPYAALVVDRYDEDWTRLAWLMLQGRAEILPSGPEHDRAQRTLRARYPQLTHAHPTPPGSRHPHRPHHKLGAAGSRLSGGGFA